MGTLHHILNISSIWLSVSVVFLPRVLVLFDPTVEHTDSGVLQSCEDLKVKQKHNSP